MIKKILTLFIFLLAGTGMIAQQRTRIPEYRIVNWGFRLGVNALSPTHYQVYNEGIELENSTIRNKVGYQGTLFFRINLSNFFMQPEASWNYYREKCSFSIPSSGNSYPENTSISINDNSGSVIVLAGYNIVREGPWLFNGFMGSNFRYTYQSNYSTDRGDEFENKEQKYNINGIIGFSLSISRLYFDFRYEISRPNTDIIFSEIDEAPEYLKEISIKKNENILSFSCGMMF